MCIRDSLLHLGKRQFQSQSKCQHRRFGWLIEFIRTDLREELPVNVCLLVALGIRHAALDVYKRQALNYEVVSEAISSVRCSAPLSADWKKRIDEDYKKRGGRKHK